MKVGGHLKKKKTFFKIVPLYLVRGETKKQREYFPLSHSSNALCGQGLELGIGTPPKPGTLTTWERDSGILPARQDICLHFCISYIPDNSVVA